MEEIYVIIYSIFDSYENSLHDLPTMHIVCFVETEQEAKDFVTSAQLYHTDGLYSYKEIKRG